MSHFACDITPVMTLIRTPELNTDAYTRLRAELNLNTGEVFIQQLIEGTWYAVSTCDWSGFLGRFVYTDKRLTTQVYNRIEDLIRLETIIR